MALLARVPQRSPSGAASRDGSASLPLPFAVVVSLLLHAVVLTITFSVTPSPRQPVQQLDVVLVNARHEKPPEQADVLAQANLDGGGTTDARDARPSNPTPPRQQDVRGDALVDARRASPPPPAASEPTVSEPPRQEPVADATMRSPDEPPPVMTSPQQPAKVPTATAGSPPEPAAKPQPPETAASTPRPPLAGQDLRDSISAIAKLEAQIDRRLDELAKRPRKVHIGTRAREHRFAQYAEDWRQKVERIGTLNYPEAARGKLYGNLVLTVSIRSDGTVDRIEVDRSSGHDVLDRAAIEIVRLAAPYAPFPPDIRSDTDIIEITRTWSFTNANQLKTR
jgi:periplasmic protein TonB